MSRNANRIKASKVTSTPTKSPPAQQMTYSPPTTHVVLPSGGKFYSSDHSLHGCETVEVKQMTTREEEILTNPSLLQQGLVVDRLIKSVAVDSTIEPSSLLIGDKNAILIALRIDAYGKEYEVDLSCTNCGMPNHTEIDLSSLGFRGLAEDIEVSEEGTFTVSLPRTEATVELRPLTGVDEQKIAETNKKTKKHGLERPIATQYSYMIAKVNGDSDINTISAFAANLPAFDSRALRAAYKKVSPDVDMTFECQCNVCGYEQGSEVPITANFFWAE